MARALGRVVGTVRTGLIASMAVAAAFHATCATAITVTDVRSGALCLDEAGRESVCVEAVEIPVRGERDCPHTHPPGCTYFGFSFSYEDYREADELLCTWRSRLHFVRADGSMDSHSGFSGDVTPELAFGGGSHVYSNYVERDPSKDGNRLEGTVECWDGLRSLFTAEFRLLHGDE